ncbi:sensor histidine kinase [Ilyobacter polytropus]|uniref:histidine kinase n=1 Tax=Ilyobacter polytropus (strain ATCC 51220 / DSM 2926 / LMG 16218 / CuHBu1) TaxID=572544 RepID=E3H6S8_ILYPC|nr:sensor histidine kinase [Ilyobacter polytropus]ADO82447.1 integral membrane sensor signal transduction histidine kinase [Ilyobacter polytropus DSM 2926]
MRLKKDSLLLKIIFYNNMAVLLTASMIAFILAFITLKDIGAQVPKLAAEKIKTLDRYYTFYMSKMRDDISMISQNPNTFFDSNTSQNSRLNYQLLSDKLKSQLEKQNYKIYNDTIFSIIGKNNEIIGESGDEEVLKKFSASKSRNYLNFINKRSKYQMKTSFSEKISDDIIVRISVPYYGDPEIKAYVLTFMIDEKFLEVCHDFMGLEAEHKIFLLSSGDYSKGTLEVSNGEKFLSDKVRSELQLRDHKYFYIEKTLNKEPYYMALYPIRNTNGIFLGSIGIAISQGEVIRIKALVFLFIASVAITLILFNSTFFGKIFYKTLTPLAEIAEASDRISQGDYDVDLKIKSTGEIGTLIMSFKKMIKTIRCTQNKLRSQNLKLQENIFRINVIERLLLGIHVEDDIFDVIRSIANALTSEMGLGYSRAIFLRYSREIESLVGEYAIINSNVIETKDDGVAGAVGGFRFQSESLNELVSYIKIPVRKPSLMAESVKDKKIIYHNDRGYKYNLGNEFLMSLGLNNFIIIPIYSNERDYGCILVDNFMKDRVVTTEEVELLNLLILNLGIHFKNRILEEEKIDNERAITIGKLSEKFLDGRKPLLEKIDAIVEKAKLGTDDFRKEILELERELLNVKRENSILTDYSDMKEYRFEVFDLESLFEEIYNEHKDNMISNNITVSLFVKSREKIYGDRAELKKAFTEIIDNAFDAVIKSDKTNKKINIILSRAKNTEKVRIRIFDNGIGMNESQLQNIYEPFVSYKKNASGLGLSIAYRIIKHHRGIIKFESQENVNTQAKITLNAYKEEK